MGQVLDMPRAKRNDVPAKLDADVVRKAKYVALGNDVSLAEYLSGLLKPLVDRDYVDAVAKLNREAGGSAPKRK